MGWSEVMMTWAVLPGLIVVQFGEFVTVPDHERAPSTRISTFAVPNGDKKQNLSEAERKPEYANVLPAQPAGTNVSSVSADVSI